MSKVIQFTETNQFGNLREFVLPLCKIKRGCKCDAHLIQALTNRGTLTPEIRENITALSNGSVVFELVK